MFDRRFDLRALALFAVLLFAWGCPDVDDDDVLPDDDDTTVDDDDDSSVDDDDDSSVDDDDSSEDDDDSSEDDDDSAGDDDDSAAVDLNPQLDALEAHLDLFIANNDLEGELTFVLDRVGAELTDAETIVADAATAVIDNWRVLNQTIVDDTTTPADGFVQLAGTGSATFSNSTVLPALIEGSVRVQVSWSLSGSPAVNVAVVAPDGGAPDEIDAFLVPVLDSYRVLDGSRDTGSATLLDGFGNALASFDAGLECVDDLCEGTVTAEDTGDGCGVAWEESVSCDATGAGCLMSVALVGYCGDPTFTFDDTSGRLVHDFGTFGHVTFDAAWSLGEVCACDDNLDQDGDGFTPNGGDCDDGDDQVFPGATELCDEIDSDCDDSIADEFDDLDADGLPDCVDLDDDGDGVEEIADCNDADPLVFPGATELCDEVDSDCDGTLADEFDDLDADDLPDCIDLDDDGDTFEEDVDCDDQEATTFPGATELCDDVDSDCDGTWADEFDDLDGDDLPDCIDEDADGDGDPGNTDCDDLDPNVFTGALEACDGLDTDCDGSLSAEELDDDGDGVTECDGDCDDADDANFPGNAEVCDGADNDCDGLVPADETDDDGDGLNECAGLDCDDADDQNFPGNVEICDGQDNDCDGGLGRNEVDDDGDGVTECDGDCDDLDDANFPGNPEICDSQDNDCDGSLGGDEIDDDGDGVAECDGDCDDGDDANFPGNPEICDGQDNDCSGAAGLDEIDNDGDGLDECADGDCDDGDDANFPGNPEICDGQDNDCDEALDEGFDVDGDGVTTCAGDCDDGDDNNFPGNPEVCDGQDNDCSGGPGGDEADGDGDGVIECLDCDDDDEDNYPGNVEVCDLQDNDCGSDIDEGFDVDGDGVTSCGGDCDDGDDQNFPGNPEICDDQDNNCDGVPSFNELDGDGDGVTECDGDCADNNSEIHLGHPELCDALDNDCDGLTDIADPDYLGSDFDEDGDPGPACGGADCDDFDPAVDRLDRDGDGPSSCFGDCDDYDPYVGPSEGEVCDGVDNDCDGLVDLDDPDFDSDGDGDGVVTADCGQGGTDCDDRDPHVFPDTLYTSGVEPACEPAVYPGFEHEFHHARVSLPSYFQDPVSGDHFLYFRGHHTQEVQAIGYVDSPDGVTWSDPVGPILEANPGEWDSRNISQPSVAFVPGLARPYVMAYHGRHPTSGLRQIGLASATAPEGPFERLNPNNSAPITAPVLPPAAAGPDNDRTLHPSLHFDGAILHLWYNGRANPNVTLNILHATSSDGGMTWTRTDEDANSEADILFNRDDVPWSSGHTSQVNFVEDPFDAGAFEFWFTAGAGPIGYATATDAITWTNASDAPALEEALNCRRQDGEIVSGRGIRYDAAADAYHWYYGGQTDLVDCVANDQFGDVYANPGNTVSYVAYGVNLAPDVSIDTPASPASSMTFTGEITDTAPDQVVITLGSSVDEFLGTAVVVATGNSNQGEQTTTWSLAVTGLSSGSHDITVTAVDEAFTIREDTVTIVVPGGP